MSDRIAYEYLEEKYNELLDKMIAIKKECEHNINVEKMKYEINIKHIKQKKRKYIIGLAIKMVICIIALTFVIGTYFLPSFCSYQYEELTNGKDVVCYVTNSGECYHKISCGYLKSMNKTTMYQAEMDGYKPCKICWSYPNAVYRTVIRTNYFQKYGTIFAVLTCISLILFYIIYKKKDRKFKEELESEKSNLNDYKNLLLKTAFSKLGSESVFEIYAKSYSCVPCYVEYHDGLPITEDGRFKVYRSFNGKCYHKNPVCRGNNLSYKLHIFSAMKSLAPCHFCATKMEIPAWHKKYIKLHNLYKEIVNICK